MSKTPTKIVQKKKEKKPWNTEIQRLEKKKRCSKLCLQMQRNTKFQETKICLAVYTKKTEQKFGGYLYKYGLLRCFHKWAVSKRKKKKKKKNAKPRIIQIWCSREIIRNKKTREKKMEQKRKKKTVSRKKRYTNLCLQKPKVLRNTSVKKHKCQET